MSLAKIVQELDQLKMYAQENVDTGPRETMAGRRGRKSQAIERSKALRRDYRLQLLESAAFIVVTGEKKQEFVSAATESFGCFSANPTEFYEDIVNRIPEQSYKGGESMVNLFDIIGRHLEDKCVELDLSGYNAVLFKQEYYVSVKSKEDLVSLLMRAVNDQMGAEIVGIQAVTSIVDKAIEAKYAARVTPIILATDDEKLALSLSSCLGRLRSKGNFLVVAGKGTKALKVVAGMIPVKDPTTENVEKALVAISGTAKQ